MKGKGLYAKPCENRFGLNVATLGQNRGTYEVSPHVRIKLFFLKKLQAFHERVNKIIIFYTDENPVKT